VFLELGCLVIDDFLSHRLESGTRALQSQTVAEIIAVLIFRQSSDDLFGDTRLANEHPSQRDSCRAAIFKPPMLDGGDVIAGLE